MTSSAENEHIYSNGNIYTLDPALPKASVLGVRGQDLIYVGNKRDEAAALLSPRAENTDLRGRAVIPGLIDGHAHLVSEGLKLAGLDLFFKSKKEILDMVHAEAGRLPPGQWITGHGWNQVEWGQSGWPDKEELDAAAPDHPVVLDRLDKHSLWANSLALQAAGLNGKSPSPEGGEILKNSRGELQGILVGTATLRMRKAIPPVDETGRHRALLRAQAEFLGYGVTSLMDAASSLQDLAILRRAYAGGELKLRIRAMLLAHGGQDAEYLDGGGKAVRGLYQERLSIDGIKILADGSLGSRSALLLDDYADRPGHRGNSFCAEAELLETMRRARKHGFTLAVHAIGDAAVRLTLDSMERVLGPKPGDHRWRMEHMQIVAEEDLKRLLALGVVPSIQTVGLMSDLDMAEERLGPLAIKKAYAWRELLKQGGRPVNGSDCPVQSPNPFLGIYAAVARKNRQGRPERGWYPEHGFTREEALKSYTSWAAWSEFSERRKGTLSSGKLADFAVLDQDLFTCSEDALKDIRVVMTVLGGQRFVREEP
ncbi:MAG: amidohydrolase [Deltaproteobacteria bacterium]|jgi:predicted amidohydrolase YtcJ|nr:amidohydrolase [Deltaproteobacteria bacterium]